MPGIMRLEKLAGKRRRRKLDLSSNYDIALLRLFLLALLACTVATVAVVAMGVVDSIIEAIPVFSFSLVIVGLVSFAGRFRWYYTLILLALVALLYSYGVETIILLFLVYAVLGGFGVVAVIVTLQRKLFYRTLARIEGMSLRKDLELKDKILVFFFNIPDDINTNDLMMDHNMRRENIPLEDTLRTMGMGFLIGVFLWIYISLNPSLLTAYSLEYILLVMFLLTLYLPFLVLPWSIFRSLDVRIKGPYHDLRLYKGAVTTLKKIAIPIIPIALYTIGAVRRLSLAEVGGFIGMSILFNIIIMATTTVIYFALYERDLIDDIVAKWRIYRPRPVLAEVVRREEGRAPVPGTPKRSYSMEDLPEVIQGR